MSPHRPLALLTLFCCAILAAACASQPPVASAPVAAEPAPSATTAPSATSAPSVTPAPPTPSPLPPTVTPEPAAAPRVGLQVGHWKIEDHPEEQARLRKFSGAYYRGYDEWELNILIAEEARARLEAAGVTVELIPATVPVGYSADVFVSIHVDGVTGQQAATRRGWKVATPFRASAASEALAAAITASYPTLTGLPDDPQGPSFLMRGYYAFGHFRYWHTVDPTTPAVIIECGFMTHPADRELLFGRTDLVGQGIAEGILAYLQAHHPASAAFRAPVEMQSRRPGIVDLPLRAEASLNSAVKRTLEPGEALLPMAEYQGWLLVSVPGRWDLGWVRAEETLPSDAPMRPLIPCCGE